MSDCLYCKNLLSGDKRNKFCSRSCAASYNNTKIPKRKATKSIDCIECKDVVILKKKSDGGYYFREYCDRCLLAFKLHNIAPQLSDEDLVKNQTKSDLYLKRKNWQSANSAIRKHARNVYCEANLLKVCKICNYDKHIEVCHIKTVKDFSGTSLISEINAISNLIALCVNHHWELDNNMLDQPL